MAKQKKYRYYVAFRYIDYFNEQGFGSKIVEMNKPLESKGTIEELTDHIEITEEYEGVVILFFKELEGGGVDEQN